MLERTVEEWDAILGDDITYWMSNPFLDGTLRASKVVWWLNKATEGSEQNSNRSN